MNFTASFYQILSKKTRLEGLVALKILLLLFIQHSHQEVADE